MPSQTSKKTLLSTRSVALDTLDSASFYDVTLSGNGMEATAHTNLTRINSILKGDTLRALGGNNTLTGGVGRDLLISSGSNNLLVAGAGADTLVSGVDGATFLISNAAQLAVNSISGGAGSDTLRLGSGVRAADAQFSKIRGVEILSLGGGASVTLAGSARAAGISSVLTGAGGGTVQGASYNGSLTLESGAVGARALLTGSASQANFFRATAGALATSTMTGGIRNDTLSVLGGGSNLLPDSLFANLSRLDTLLLQGGGRSSVTLGAGAERAGFTTIIGSDAGISIRQEQRQTRAMTLAGGSGDDLFSFSSTARAVANSIIGGNGLDTIHVDTGTMADPFFRRVSGIEVLSLGSGTSVTLGNTASSKGLQTVVAGAQNVSVQAGSMEAQLTLDASAVAGRVYLDGSSGGSLFLLGDAAALASSTLRGGIGEDTLAMKVVGSYDDTSFARMRGIEVMQLSGGANSVVLGNSARMSGLSTLISGSTGGDTITQTAGGYYLDASAALTGVYFNVASPALLAGSDTSPATTIVGGAGIDTLIIGPGDFSDTTFFSNIRDVEAISFAGLSSGGAITLDAGLAEFFTTIVGSSGPMTFTQTEGSFCIDGRAGDSNLFDLLADGGLLAEDTILGGDGVDSLFLGESTLDEDAFNNVSSVEFLSLGGSVSLVLGAAASSAGVSSLFGGEGDNTIGITAGSYYLDGSLASSNLFSISEASLLSGSTIIGNSDADTLSVESGALEDVDFVNLSGVPALQLVSDVSVQFGALALDAGIVTLFGGEGNAIVELLAGGLDLEAGDATGTFLVNAANSGVMAASTFVGNGEGSTLSFSEGDISDEAFANVKSVGSVLLEGSSFIELGDGAAAAELSTVAGGAGDSTFSQTAGSFLLDGSGGTSNLFALSSAALAAGDTIIGTGNDGNDTLAFTEEDSLSDDSFANISGVSVLSLTGSSNATLGAAAATTGIVQVITGDGDSTLLLDQDGPSILLDGESSSSLLVGIAEASLASTTTLYGGSGIDTLAFGDASAIGDESFVNITGFEVISVTGGSSLTLGAAASAGGLDSIYGGSGTNTISQTAENANALHIDGGSGQLRVELDDVYYLFNDTILGGTGGSNTLSVNGPGSIFDSHFTNHEHLQTMLLAGDNHVELGTEAADAGITKVIVADGDNSFMVTADGPAGLTLDASAGTGDNKFTFNNADQLATARIHGAHGNDTLAFANEAVISDTLFARTDGIEVLSLTGASIVTLGSHADTAGIVSVFGGSGGTIFTQDSLSNSSRYLDGRADIGNGNLFAFSDASVLPGNTLVGGDSFDTLRVTSGSVIDDGFRRISSVEILQLVGSGSVLLGGYADQSGLMTVVGGIEDNTFTHDASSEYSYYLDGRSGNRNLFVAATASNAAVDTFAGGAGTDTLRIDSGRIEDYLFSNHSSIEVLQLSGTSNVTLGSSAGASGISTIHGGSGATSLDASAMSGTLVIDAGAGTGASFLLGGTGADNVTGGSGADTLRGWATTGNTTSDTLSGGSGADLFVLGDDAGNGYGTGASKALIKDFTGGIDYLQLHDYGTGAGSYRVNANAGSGYTHQLFDTNSGSDVLLANINYSGSDVVGDLLGARAIFA